MKASEIREVVVLAESKTNLGDEDTSMFFGIVQRQGKVYVTRRQAASFVRWQAMQLNGTWDSEALHENCTILQKKTLLVD